MQVRIVNLCKEYAGNAALRDVSLTVASGELVALLGPSGSGKTTLLRTVAGLEFPDRGQILFDQEDASLRPIQERRVGLVFQHYALFKHMRVADNVAFGMRARKGKDKPSEREIKNRVGELLDLVQLTGLDRRFPAQLSGGQRQRVALARALAIEPRVLLLDEPFGALDARVRKDLRRWLRELHDRTGHTTLFVTHDQDEALELADRVAVMNEGRIEQAAAPDDIYDKPATPFVMTFIGDSCVLDVAVSHGRAFLDERALDIDAVGVPDGPARLYLRPENVRLATPAEAGGPGVVSAAVVGGRRIGGMRRLQIEAGLMRHALVVDVPADGGITLGQRVLVKLTKGRIFGAMDAPPGAAQAVRAPAA